MAENLIITEREYVIEKFPGKGGWTYIKLEVILNKEYSKGGWTKIRGKIDNEIIEGYKIAPMGQGISMLPLKADLRKKLNKGEGDKVFARLEYDLSTYMVPDEIMECLEHFPEARKFFLSMTESNQRYFVDWIAEAKNDETKVNRINKVIDRLLEGKRMYDL